MNLVAYATIRFIFSKINKPIEVIADRLLSSTSQFTYANVIMLLLIKAVTQVR